MELTVKFWGLSNMSVRLLDRLAKTYNGQVIKAGNDVTFIARGDTRDILEILTRISDLEPYETDLHRMSS